MVLKHQLIYIFLLKFLFQDVLADTDEECSCVDLLLEEIKPCKDWKSAPVKFDVKVDMNDDYGSLNGKILAGAVITEGTEISMSILRQTPNGDELVYSAAGDICQSFFNKDAMWYPIVEVFNTTSCPIHKGNFDVKDVKVNLASIKYVFNKDFVGYYSIVVMIEMALTKYMCFVLGAEMIEEQRLCSECPFL